ncbi:DUF6430 domain-containing protein [Bifidobacterium amazonense]|uniref:DUF6430 domain-containing protein n=1 Tax=Bifidobacterium amazonense TaxID=2809027 RepID=A0ABS9VY25_9BIFI|nr:macro domain-containing protein [Bifidobacterium amazonense]MCH9277006.1 DUF6430 domain-containing protein [Bifidobacterium amazonense]
MMMCRHFDLRGIKKVLGERFKRFKSYRSRRSYWRKFGAAVFSALGVFCLLLDFISYICDGHLPWKGWGLTIAIIIVALSFAFIHTREKPLKTQYSFGTTIDIVAGDLFEQDCSIVVGTCSTFDTDVEHWIIARSSIQGQALDSLYHGDVARLDADIDAALKGIKAIGHINKKGKKTRYPIGTVAVLHPNDYRAYFVAYTDFDEHNTASCSIDYLWEALSSLWEAVLANGNCQPIAITAIGQGLSRMKPVLSLEDSIKLIVISYVLASRRTTISSDLRIVLRSEDYQTIDRVEMQKYLDSFQGR